MRRNRIAVSCLALVIIFFVGLYDARSAENEEAKQVTCTGKVVDEQGRPIAGVKITLYEMIYNETTYSYDIKNPSEVTTKNDGAFSFSRRIENDRYRYAYIIAEKEGLAIGWANWRMRDGDADLEIKIGQPDALAGIVVNDNNKPISQAEVSIYMLLKGEGENKQYLTGGMATKLFTVKTDEEGKFIFTKLPAKATADFLVKKTGLATINTWTTSASLTYTAGQRDIKLALPVEAKIEGIVVEKETGKPAAGITLIVRQDRNRPAQEPFDSKDDGTFSVGSLARGSYIIEHMQPSDELADWVTDPVEVITEVGKTKSGVKIELSKGGVLEVKVIDAVNKEPVENASVGVNNRISDRYSYSRSDKKGIARMRLMPGDYQLNNVYKQGYSQQRLQDTVTIEDGKTERLEYELVGMPKIMGVVRDEKGEVLEGVKLKICPMGGRDDVTTDSEGKFEMTYDPAGWGGPQIPIMYLVCRHEERNLATAVQIEEDNRSIDVKLEPGVMFIGKVVDPNGNGIKEATFYVNLRASNWGSPIGRDFPVTDEQGRFEIQAIPAEHRYNLRAQAEGYGEISKEVDIEEIVNNCFDAGTITLPVANLSVSGVVVDDNDKPVAGARIFCYGDNQPHRDTQTDVEGKFTIEKVCAGRIRINADKTGATRLYGYIETEGGATDVRIVISERPTSTRYEPRRPSSLVGRPLPELKEVGIDLPSADIDGRIMLACLFDMEQRPSRHCVTQLAKQADQLKSKGITIIAVQASKIDQTALIQWVEKYNIPFPVGMVKEDAEKARFTWGVRSLPWLILTDTKHIIRSAGFSIKELNEKLEQFEGG